MNGVLCKQVFEDSGVYLCLFLSLFSCDVIWYLPVWWGLAPIYLQAGKVRRVWYLYLRHFGDYVSPWKISSILGASRKVRRRFEWGSFQIFSEKREHKAYLRGEICLFGGYFLLLGVRFREAAISSTTFRLTTIRLHWCCRRGVVSSHCSQLQISINSVHRAWRSRAIVLSRFNITTRYYN